ncbi:MAG TPA: proprotein convertase P-domain-containing protein [Myxococcota bacterium]|jgi:subtilisin-like proprotein convertase family protein|nr:proprotein convertase P-domain-containing protein [Myxococcota bacterium]
MNSRPFRGPRLGLPAAILALAPALAFAGLAPRPARADTLDSTLGQPLIEISHSVDVSLKDGVATYVVRRTIANAGTLYEEASLDIDLPYGAAVTGLRIRAHDRWYDGELMEAEKAAKLYEQLTGLGPHAPRDPALLEWVWPDKVHLYVFPVTPGGTSTVEYTLTAPTRYRGGRYVVSYPRSAAGSSAGAGTGAGADRDADAGATPGAGELATPVLRVHPDGGDATTLVLVDGRRAAPDTPLVLDPPAPPPWFGEGAPDRDAGYATSALVVADVAGEVASARVKLAIHHTYRADLRVELVTPAGKHVVLRDREGGGESDVAGTFPVKLPAGTAAAGTWRLVVSDHAGLDVGTLDEWSLALSAKKGAGDRVFAAVDTPVFLPDAPEEAGDGALALVEVAPPPIDVLAARLGRVVAAPDKTYLRLELDAAPQLKPLPKALSVVFAVDASWSEEERGIDAQLAVARAFLTHVPDATFEVVLFRRHAARMMGSFAGAGAFDASVEAARAAGKLAPGNGSALEEGLRAAAAALAGRKGPRRIVFLTDALQRRAFREADARAALAGLPAGTVVHAAIPRLDEADEPTTERDDAHALAPVARAHGGILVHVGGLPAKEGKRLAAAVLELVRPIRIDHFRIEGFDPTTPDGVGSLVPDVIAEGTGHRAVLRLGAAAPAKLVLRGELWSAPFVRTIAAGDAFSRATAGFVFSEDRFDGLTHDEMMKVAFYGRAVSPVTSYLAVEPGTRPSHVGIMRGLGGSGSGYGGGAGLLGGYGRSGVAPPALKSLLAGAAAACVAAHPPAAGWSVVLDVETTYHEVVDVRVAAAGGARGTPAALTACLVEAAWAVTLPSSYVAERDDHRVEYP